MVGISELCQQDTACCDNAYLCVCPSVFDDGGGGGCVVATLKLFVTVG